MSGLGIIFERDTYETFLEAEHRARTQAQAIEVVSDAHQAEEAAQVMKNLKHAQNLVEACRKTAKAPFIEGGKLVDETAKSLSEPILEALDRLKGLTLTYQAGVQKKQLEEVRETGLVTTTGKMDGISTAMLPQYEIFDYRKAYQACPELFVLTPKDGEIKRLIKEGGTIPGIKGWMEPALRVRA